jgi:hypothetical protein
MVNMQYYEKILGASVGKGYYLVVAMIEKIDC